LRGRRRPEGMSGNIPTQKPQDPPELTGTYALEAEVKMRPKSDNLSESFLKKQLTYQIPSSLA
jgi:hypothetical protein